MQITNPHKKKGFTILIAIIVAAIVLAIGLSILSLIKKQLELSGLARESEIAFQAAYAGVECIRYNDLPNIGLEKFDVPQGAAPVITCMRSTDSSDKGAPRSGTEQHFQFTWDSGGADGGQICTDVSVYKFYSTSGSVSMSSVLGYSRNCPQGVECTVIKSRGYNKACSALTGDRTVEREVTAVY